MSKLLRNKEIQRLLMVMGLINAAATVVAAFISPWAALLVFLSGSLITGCSWIYTRWRYGEIARLSRYLRQISGGDYSLDIRDNQEGELSILKNEIYKVTLMLSEQNSLLQYEKLRLTDAIADISHQLKTPLTSMMVMADLLSDARLPEAKRIEFTHRIRVQLERIEWLLASLLKLARIDAGTVVFKQDVIMVSQLVQKALEPVLIPMDIKAQTFTISGDDKVSFRGDIKWTTEALINILKNCVEHSPEGGVISVSFAENALFTEIIIADNGNGIPKEDIPHIFQRFYKGKNATEDSIGIGLAMAHSIVSAQNGTIEVISKGDQGAQFIIKFYRQLI